jgi:hypothetical protein
MCTNSSCFYGTCTGINTNNQPTCICNEGFIKDYYLFHNDNCTVPQNSWLALMIISVIIHVIAAIYMIIKRRNTKSTVTQAFNFAILYCFLQPIQNVGIYVQDGNYEIGCTFTGLAAVTAGCWAWIMLKLLILPLFILRSHMKQQVSNVFFANCVLTSSAFAITIFTMCGLSRSNNDIYNAATIGQLFTGFAFSLLFASSYIYEATLFLHDVAPVLDNVMENAQAASADKTKRVVEKVIALRKQMYFFIAQLSCTLLPWVITQLVYGSAPFSWIFFAIAAMGNVVQISQLTISLTSRKIETSSSSTTNSPNNHNNSALRSKSSKKNVNGNTGSALLSTSPMTDDR